MHVCGLHGFWGRAWYYHDVSTLYVHRIFMQYLSKLASVAMDNPTIIFTDVAPKFENVKWDFITYSLHLNYISDSTDICEDNICNPHKQITYYFLSKIYNGFV